MAFEGFLVSVAGWEALTIRLTLWCQKSTYSWCEVWCWEYWMLSKVVASNVQSNNGHL